MTIHPTAIIHRTALIGEGVEIGAYCVVDENVSIGDCTVLRRYVELRADTSVGKNCYLDSGVKSSGENTIGDRVTIRYDAIIAKKCIVGDDAFISPQVMTINVDHKGRKIGGAHIGKRCHIGTAAVLHPGITVADDVVVGAKALVTKNLDEPAVYVGIPAKRK